MRFIKTETNINFIGIKNIAFYLSIACIVISFVSLIIHRGPRLGIDFAGGTLIQVKFTSAARIDDVKSGLESVGLGKSSVQQFGEKADNEFLIRTESTYGSG
ncbi:MAG: protein translocase subunit SecF, partial [Desulfobacterales bacterium]|nr:protein translocase subunit SecF [Desulfobacterales bacterium]